LDLTGGEVTDRPDFAEIAIAAHEECAWLAMLHYPSNGRHPDRLVRVTQAILDARPRRLVLSISLDGPPKLHDRLRGDKGAYQAAVESYRKVRELGVEAYFGMTLSPWNMDQVDATFDALKADVPDLTWRELHFNFLHHSEHYFENQGVKSNDTDALVNTVNAILKRRGSARRPTHMMENLYLGRIEDHVRTGKSSVPCQSMIGHAFINPKGAVYPCHIWDRPIGNLRDHAFALDKIWALEQAAQVRQEVAAERCPGCWTPCEAYPSIMANLPLYVTSMVR
jgi:MoaA/NifB/PqqE/SkfB family radical SAM enzyme